MRNLQQQVAQAEIEKQRLLQNANDWMKTADRFAEQRDVLDQRLRSGNDRGFVAPVNTQPAGYQQNPANDRGFLGGQRGGFQAQTPDLNREPIQARTPLQIRDSIPTRGTVYGARSQAEIMLEENTARLEQIAFDQAAEIGRLKALPERSGANEQRIQPTAWVGGNADANANQRYGRNPDGTLRVAEKKIDYPRNDQVTSRQGPNNRPPPPEVQRGDEENMSQGSATGPGHNLIWLLPLLLGSLALNFFLWHHSRTLSLQYTDLADELRSMVGGASTI